MATRSLDQIIAELNNSTFNPQIENIRKQQALIPEQVNQEEQALRAQEEDYYTNSIMGDARRRGIAFSGIPLAERARYGATQFLPQLARNRAQARQQAMSLEDTILGINERRNTMAQQIRQQDVDNDYRERSFAEDVRRYNEQVAESRRQAAAAAAAQNGFLSAFSGGGQAQQPQQQAATQRRVVSPIQQAAEQDVLARVQQGSPTQILSDYLATYKSAQYGNQRDQLKLQAYAAALQRLQPVWGSNQNTVREITNYFSKYDPASRNIILNTVKQPSAVPAWAITSNKVSF